jgi:hypothetical protein
VPWSNCREEGCVPKRILTYHKAVMPRVQNQGKGISPKFVPRSLFYCVSVCIELQQFVVLNCN